MNHYLLALILGIIEGITEFLPISSTAHLRIAQSLFNVPMDDSFWKMFSIVIQLGAVLCLPIYFWRRIIAFARTFPSGGNRPPLTHPLTLTLLAFVVTAVPAFLLSKVIHKKLEQVNLMGWALLVGGLVMLIIDLLFANRGNTEELEQMSLFQAIWIGLCQITSAVVPGTSRSMSTIAAGQVAGMTRATALEFSFFLSIPTMFAATGYELLKTLHEVGKAATQPIATTSQTFVPTHVSSVQWLQLGIGFVVSFFVAWAVVAWFMNWVRKRGFAPFAVYRIILGLAVLIWMR